MIRRENEQMWGGGDLRKDEIYNGLRKYDKLTIDWTIKIFVKLYLLSF